MRNIIRFIMNFVRYWHDYDFYRWFKYEHLSKEAREELEKADKDRGVEPHDKNRFDYAWHNTLIWWKHRDRYGKKCTGDCENCENKHC